MHCVVRKEREGKEGRWQNNIYERIKKISKTESE
jgi:hypothetical protein